MERAFAGWLTEGPRRPPQAQLFHADLAARAVQITHFERAHVIDSKVAEFTEVEQRGFQSPLTPENTWEASMYLNEGEAGPTLYSHVLKEVAPIAFSPKRTPDPKAEGRLTMLDTRGLRPAMRWESHWMR